MTTTNYNHEFFSFFIETKVLPYYFNLKLSHNKIIICISLKSLKKFKKKFQKKLPFLVCKISNIHLVTFIFNFNFNFVSAMQNTEFWAKCQYKRQFKDTDSKITFKLLICVCYLKIKSYLHRYFFKWHKGIAQNSLSDTVLIF